MNDERSLKVFLGSSITELEDERVRISDSISQDLTRLFENNNIVIRFLKCESIHDGNDGTPDQDKIDEMLSRCDVSLFLFKDKEGDGTIHEYEIARKIQKEKKHKIYVYYLLDGEKKKPEKLTPFQEQLVADGVFWKYCDSLIDLKYQFALGLLKDFGVHCGATVRAAGEVKKDGEALFEQCQQDHQLMHQEIEKLLAQIGPVMDDADTPIAARITQVLGIYQKADLWASKTDYDKEKYSHLLFDYALFLYKYGMYYDAEQVYLRQIPLAEELYGKEHEKTATSYNEIGVVYKAQGDYPQALEYYGKALAIFEKVLGTDHPDTASSYNNIGLVYDAQGNYPQALEYYGKALAIFEKVLGKEHPSTATSYVCIGMVYYNQGDYPQALEYYGKALAIDEKVLGKEHPGTATDYNNIGTVYDDQGDYPQALEYYGKALAIFEKVLGTEHPDTATSYNNIGSLYYQWGKYPEALEYLEKALKICQAKLGDNHPYTIGTQKWIDATQAAMGKK